MKAAIINKYGDQDVFEVCKVPVPDDLKDDELMINVRASSINPVDWKIRKGNLKMILGSHFPIILGFDAAGVVEKTGKNVTKYKKGDKVYARLNRKYGRAYAEYAISSEDTFAIIPDNISFEEAAGIPLAALTALQALRDKCKIKKDDKVLINGAASGVGHFALQLVNYSGARATAVCSPRHQSLMNELKPEVLIDYTKDDFKQNEEKYDIIFDVVGTESYLTCKNSLKPQGIFITSLPRPKLLFHKLVSLFNSGKVKTVLMKANSKDMDYISNLVKQNKIKCTIDKVFPLKDISKAHHYSEEGHANGKIVISI